MRWGMAVGAVGGFGYGVISVRRDGAGPYGLGGWLVGLYTVAGAAYGLVGGAAVYLVRTIAEEAG